MARTDRTLKKLYGGRGNVSLREELELIGSQIAHLSERAVGDGQEKLNEEIVRLKGAFDEVVDRARDTTSSSVEMVSAKVQQRPLESLLGAFAVGALFAAFFARR